MSAPGTLFVVASPIGNPADLSPRSVEALRDADVIFAEDTRTAQRLLATLGLDRPTRSCFDANEAARAGEAATLLAEGKRVVVLSEAGTPAVSDPGYRLIRGALAVNAKVVPIPGPSAVLAALVGSGLPPDRFLFAGFPPRRPGARRRLFDELRAVPATLIFFESPHRVPATLADLAASLGPSRAACVARELTKVHEEFVRGTLGELAHRYETERPLGEITIVVGAEAAQAPSSVDDAQLRSRAAALLAEGKATGQAAALLADEAKRPRREMYDLILDVRRNGV